MGFYASRAIDPSGGMYHFFLDDGTVFDKRMRHFVSATRFVITHAILYKLTGEVRYQAGVLYAVEFLRRTTAFATLTNITGYRPNRSLLRLCWRSVPGSRSIGNGTSGFGTIAGRISSIISRVPGSAFSTPATSTIPVKRVRQAKSITTILAFVAMCCARWVKSRVKNEQ